MNTTILTESENRAIVATAATGSSRRARVRAAPTWSGTLRRMGEVHTLDDAKARRLGGRTMLIPTVEEVRAAIQAIPEGASKTALELRRELAQTAGAEVTCPYAFRMGWFAVAEEGGAPWWRVTRDGKPEPRLPGGTEGHRTRLAEEGVRMKGT